MKEKETEQYEAHIEAFFNPPPFLRRDKRLSDVQLRNLLRPMTEWIMPHNRGSQIMKTIEVKDRLAPVEVTVKSTGGMSTEKFDNMEKFEAWFDDKRHKFVGHLADVSMTMITIELIEPEASPSPKGKKGKTKAVDQDERRKQELETDRQQAKMAKKFHDDLKKMGEEREREKAAKGKGAKEEPAPSGKEKGAKEEPAPSGKGKGAKEKPSASPAPQKGGSRPSSSEGKGGATRHGVKVSSSAFKGEKEYSSLRYAFEDLKLPWPSAAFQKFRSELKAAGKGTFKNEKGAEFNFVAVAK